LAVLVYVEKSHLTPQERQQVEEEQNRVGLKLALDLNLSRAKQLPAKAEQHVPRGRELAKLLTRNDA